MNQRDLKKIEKLLLKEKEKILKQLSFEKDSIDHLLKQESGDSLDNAANMYAKTLTINMSEHDKKILKSINDALLRIANQRFGICIRCKNKINVERLFAVPWTLTCVDIKICNAFLKKNKKKVSTRK